MSFSEQNTAVHIALEVLQITLLGKIIFWRSGIRNQLLYPHCYSETQTIK